MAILSVEIGRYPIDMTVERNPPSDVVADRLHSAAIHVLRSVRGQDVQAGVGPAALSALSVLVFGGPRTVGELARAEQVRSPTMSGVLKGLEAGGLVRRERVAEDARRSVVHATARGRRLMQRARRRRIDALARRVEELEPGERALLLAAAELMERVAAGSPRVSRT
jgi:DNA-binding MarR family transcriptional regulator